MNKLERVLAEQLAKVTTVDVVAIIEALTNAIVGTDIPVADEPEPPKAAATTLNRKSSAPEKVEPPAETPAKAEPAEDEGEDLDGLLVGDEGTINKEKFLRLVEGAADIRVLSVINETCDCGFDTSKYDEESIEILRRKLGRWGKAQ